MLSFIQYLETSISNRHLLSSGFYFKSSKESCYSVKQGVETCSLSLERLQSGLGAHLRLENGSSRRGGSETGA